jgi:transcriptional regulator with XRE-family HTH domain
MATEAIYANKLAAERERQGLGTADELARRADIAPELYAQIEAGELLPTTDEMTRLTDVLGIKAAKLYPLGLLGSIGLKEGAIYEVSLTEADLYRELREPTRLLVSREEMSWLERAAQHPEGEYDVFLNLSCSTQMYPTMMLDAVAVMQALDVDFAAGSGPEFCCGGYLRIHHTVEAGVKMADRSVQPIVARKATTHVSQCTQCINNFTATSRRRVADGGEATPLRQMQLTDFLIERIEEMGGDVPWARSVDRKVLVHGHKGESPVVTKTVDDCARLLRLVPGVEVVGILERTFMNDFCYTGDLPGYPTTPEQMQARRHDIAAIARSYGADTVAIQHQDCSRIWAPFASVDLAIKNVVSIVAEALGCENPDRVQAAYMLGDPDAVVEQTRPIWTSWGLSEEEARTIAHREYKPVNTAKVAGCSCGRGGCGSEIIDLEVLEGVDWKSAMRTATRATGEEG